MKRSISYTLEEEVIKLINSKAKKDKRSSSYIVNQIIEEALKGGNDK